MGRICHHFYVIHLLLSIASLGMAMVGEGGKLVECQIKNDREKAWVMNQILQQQLDLWDDHIDATPSMAKFLVSYDQLIFLKSVLNCEQAIDVALLERQFTHYSKTDPANVNFSADYRNFDEIIEKLRSYQREQPDLVSSLVEVGKSHENRPIHVVHLGKRIKSIQPRVICISAGQHAREWIASAAVMYMIDALLKGYQTSQRIKTIMENFEFVIFPMVNPDGYEFSRKTYRYWRKNRRPNDDGSFGVDLNRNWPNRWGLVGSSDYALSDIYQGPWAGSEPEVNATSNYIRSLSNLAAGIDVHSYGELILRNFGWTVDPSPDEGYLAGLGNAITQRMNVLFRSNYESKRSGELYPSGGSLDDWFYEQMHVPGFTLEIRDKGGFGFLLPPQQIIPTGRELLEGVLTLCERLLATSRATNTITTHFTK